MFRSFYFQCSFIHYAVVADFFKQRLIECGADNFNSTCRNDCERYVTAASYVFVLNRRTCFFFFPLIHSQWCCIKSENSCRTYFETGTGANQYSSSHLCNQVILRLSEYFPSQPFV